jgi:outer membrane murein-binding lipoprotein Lpp
MKTVARIALCALLISGCGARGSTINDLKAQVDDLNHRVKLLEDDLLKADKQLIQQQQAMQQMHEQLRDMENYFNKIQAGQTSVPR